MARNVSRGGAVLLCLAIVGAAGGHDAWQCMTGWTSRELQFLGGRPSIGAVASKVQGSVDPSVPPFVGLAAPTKHKPWSDPGTAGFLGPAYTAFRPDGPGMADMKLRGVTVERLAEAQAVEPARVRVLGRIGGVDAVDLGRLEQNLRADLLGAQRGGRVGGEVRVARTAGEDADAPLLQVAQAASPNEGLGDALHLYRAEHPGGHVDLLERVLKRPAGESEWFFEEREVVKFLDHGAFGVMLDVLTHTVVSIIAAERSDAPGAAEAASAGADLAGASAGVLHNLLHPSLRGWNTRKPHQTLLATIEQVFRMEGCPLNDPKGTPVEASQSAKQFTALCAKVLGNPGALAVLTGHAATERARLQLLRAIVQQDQMSAGKSSDASAADVAARMTESARALVVLRRCRVAGGRRTIHDADGVETDAPKPAWEPVIDAMLTTEGADEMRDEVKATIEQHSLLAGAFKKFGFEGSVGI